jgi:hypothetical protein
MTGLGQVTREHTLASFQIGVKPSFLELAQTPSLDAAKNPVRNLGICPTFLAMLRKQSFEAN